MRWLPVGNKFARGDLVSRGKFLEGMKIGSIINFLGLGFQQFEEKKTFTFALRNRLKAHILSQIFIIGKIKN